MNRLAIDTLAILFAVILAGYFLGRLFIWLDPGFESAPRNAVLEEEYRDVVRQSTRPAVVQNQTPPTIIYQQSPAPYTSYAISTHSMTNFGHYYGSGVRQ